MDSPVTIDFVERGAAFEHGAIDGNLVTGTHAQAIADLYGIERHVLIAAVTLDAPRGLWRKVEECADCAGRRLACAQLQNLAHQHQHGDDAGRFEIDGRCAAVAAERLGENSRHESRSQAVDIGNAGAHGDQREHVEIARSERLPSAHEKRPAGPQHYRRRESELNVIRWRRLDPIVGAERCAHPFPG